MLLEPQLVRGRPGRSATRRARLAALSLAVLASGACSDGTAPEPVIPVCDTPGQVQAGSETIPVAPNGYAAVGNQIIRASDCAPHRFVGVSWPSLLLFGDFHAPEDSRLSEAAMAADFGRIRGWNANVVRIELNQSYWVRTARAYNPQYAAWVDQAVRQARAAGLDVILALQHSDRGDPNYAGTQNPQQPMADVNHSIPFWREVAERYKDDGRVIYELFSEPYPIEDESTGKFSNWSVWLNGGRAPADRVYNEQRQPYEAAGMQQLYEAVRSTGANNLVILGGTHWGYSLAGVPTHRVRGYNIAYAAHPWDYPDKQPATWDRDFGFLADTDPVILTEFGNYDCSTPYVQSVLDYADRKELSWVAWAWMAPPRNSSEEGRRTWICTFPMLLTDWGGTPSEVGQVVRSRLGSY